MKPANVAAVLRFAHGEPSPVQGTKLQALYTLIQKYGQTVTTNKGTEVLNGAKCLEIVEGTFVAITRRAVGPAFYPCSMQTHLMQVL